MIWYKIRLTKGQVSAGALISLKKEFQRLWRLVGTPKDMALFAGSPFEKKNEQCFYLTPGCLPWAESIISRYFASPCEKPFITDYPPSLLVGHPEAKRIVEGA